MIRELDMLENGGYSLSCLDENDEEEALLDRLMRAGLLGVGGRFTTDQFTNPWPPTDPGMTREEAIEALKVCDGEYAPLFAERNKGLLDAVFGPEKEPEAA